MGVVLLKLRPYLPKLRKKFDLEHLAQIGYARRAAGSALQADDALDRGDVVEAPAAKIVFEIDEFFGEFIEPPVFLGRCVDALPGIQHLVIRSPRLAPIRSMRILAN